jgi:S1-C subfamily serine protease
VEGPTPIPYDQFFGRMGVTSAKTKVAGNPFYKAQGPYITVNPQTKEIVVIPGIELPEFYPALGIKSGDIITGVNGKNYNLDNIYDMIMESQGWKEDDAIAIKIKRDGKEQELKGKVKLPYEEMEGYKSTDDSKKALRDAWLKG